MNETSLLRAGWAAPLQGSLTGTFLGHSTAESIVLHMGVATPGRHQHRQHRRTGGTGIVHTWMPPWIRCWRRPGILLALLLPLCKSQQAVVSGTRRGAHVRMHVWPRQAVVSANECTARVLSTGRVSQSRQCRWQRGRPSCYTVSPLEQDTRPRSCPAPRLPSTP